MVGVLGAAASSQAQISLILASSGNGAQISSTQADITEAVFIQSPGSPALSGVAYTLNITTLAGSGFYTGTGETLDFNLQFDPNSYQNVGPSGGSIDGTWTYTGGTGGYAGFKNGSGTLALTYLLTSPTTAMTATTFQGMLATPEPAPLAALGIGALGLLMRRRRR